jgi:ribosomal protein S18 acetylase RimI-like enzyme
MNIRRLGLSEESAVLKARALFDEDPDPSAVRAYLADDRNTFLLALEGQVPIGFLRSTELGQLKSKRRQMFLYEIAVEEKHRGRGVGKALIRALLHDCRQREIEEVFVFTDPANEPAVKLYRSTGAITETPADRMFVYRLGPGSERRG